jgi:hypothetical protein
MKIFKFNAGQQIPEKRSGAEDYSKISRQAGDPVELRGLQKLFR